MAVTSEVFSLWYVPPPGSLQKVQETIQQLASRYSAPVFPAHMTLVGGIRAPEATVRRISEELVDTLEPVGGHITCVDYGSIYHQCVFLKVECTEELEFQYRLAQRKFSMDENVQYMPHISLLYSDIDQKERERLTSEQQEGSFHDMGRIGFDTIELWYTPPEDVSLGSWRRLESYSLKKK
ncbi:hypothetical protein M9435_003038 [Picochlorum sp. BPE23]|nr:hypothetical protein M9435_003038 [Picochlorum sp. BPE23]